MQEDREPEIWKPIPEYEGLYEVSSWGNVRSLKRIVKMSFGRTRVLPDRMMSGKIVGKYLRVQLYEDGKSINCHLNRLVASVYIGDVVGKIINHKDLDTFNNYYKNLEIINQRENVTYSSLKTEKSSKFVGVSFHIRKIKRPWNANIWINKKGVSLGYYDTEEEAHQAYLNALKEYGLINKYATENQD